MMSKTILDVLTLGDLMVDFTPAGISPKGNLLYERNPGGAPANVAVTVSRLGGKSGFLGTVSDDIFGHFLADAMTKFGVNIQGLNGFGQFCHRQVKAACPDLIVKRVGADHLLC